VDDGENRHAARVVFVQDGMRPMFVPANAFGDRRGFPPETRIVGEQLENVIEILGVGLCLLLAELFIA
jgi:hypothetical protein